ncbi:MAG: TetR/AcrR family transcriptional regulator [Chloroflexota bacterium]
MKNEILDLAQKQLKLGGYDKLNFASIADELEITRANIHHHFKNKEGLAIEATEAYMAESLGFMAELAQKHLGDFPSYLADLEQLVIQRIRQRGRVGACVCTQLIRESDIPQSLKDRAQAYFDQKLERFKHMIIESQSNRTIDPSVSPDHLALLASAMVLGIDQMALAMSDLDSLTEQLEGSPSKWIEMYLP